jgi:hypothetical protein
MDEQSYHEGMRDAIVYFYEELGYEDALETKIAEDVRGYFGDDAFDDYIN